MMVKAVNKSSAMVTMWWGHTPYFLPPGEPTEVPKELLSAAAQHDDYKDKVFLYSPEPAKLDPPSDPDAGGADSPKPWEAEDWEPLTCDFLDIVAYAAHFNLQIDAENEELAREVVIEHAMSSPQGAEE